MFKAPGKTEPFETAPSPGVAFNNFLNRLKSSGDGLVKKFEEELRLKIQEVTRAESKDVLEIEVHTKGWDVGDLPRDNVGYAETMDPQKAFELLGEKMGPLEERFSKKEEKSPDIGFTFAVKSGFGGAANGNGKAETRTASLEQPEEKSSGVKVLVRISKKGETGDVYGHEGALLGMRVEVPIDLAKNWVTSID